MTKKKQIIGDAAETPTCVRKSPHEWAAEKAVPAWLFAAASTVAALTGGEWTALTETEFDAAIDRAR